MITRVQSWKTPYSALGVRIAIAKGCYKGEIRNWAECVWHSIKHTVRAPKMVVVVVVIFIVIVFKGSIAPSGLDVSWLSKPFLLGPLVPVSEESQLPLGQVPPSALDVLPPSRRRPSPNHVCSRLGHVFFLAWALEPAVILYLYRSWRIPEEWLAEHEGGPDTFHRNPPITSKDV